MNGDRPRFKGQPGDSLVVRKVAWSPSVGMDTPSAFASLLQAVTKEREL
jgi:hypothetical protein